MSILKSEINLKGTKPKYLRSTRNLYSHTVDGRELFFSYRTLVAIDDLISINNWSVSTGRHLTWINPDKSIRVKNFEEQARKILQDNDLLKTDDHLKTVGNISAIFNLMLGNDSDQRKINNQRLKFYLTIPGIHAPDDWDKLTVFEQSDRLDKMDKLARSSS